MVKLNSLIIKIKKNMNKTINVVSKKNGYCENLIINNIPWKERTYRFMFYGYLVNEPEMTIRIRI